MYIRYREGDAKEVEKQIYTIYTDGACQGNPGPGGWAAVVTAPDGRKTELSGGAEYTTNNQMELTAVLEALRFVEAHWQSHNGLSFAADIQIHSDSQYICKAFNEGWLAGWKRNGWVKSDGNPPKNLEIWQELDYLTATLAGGHGKSSRNDIMFVWVKGHNGNPLNELCDRLAVEQAERHSKGNCGPAAQPEDTEPEQLAMTVQTNLPAEQENTDWAGYANKVLSVLDQTLMENHALACKGDGRPCGSRPYCAFCIEAETEPYPCARAYVKFRTEKKPAKNK